MTTGRFFGFLLFAVLMAALGYGASYWYRYPFNCGESSDEPEASLQQDSQAEIRAQGRLEPACGTIAVSALPGEEIVEIKVHVGQDVEAGDKLAVLSSQKVRETEYELAKAQRNTAKAEFESELALSGERIEAAALAEQQVEARKKEIPPKKLAEIMVKRKDLASLQLDKLRRLRDEPATRDAITDAEVEQQQLLFEQLEAEIVHNNNKMKAADDTQKLAEKAAQLDSTIAGLAKEGVKKADPSNVLDQTVELARLVHLATLVNAPSKGTILEIYARKGERIANTPILLLANLDQMICVAEVHEANLKDMLEKKNDGKLVLRKQYPVTIKSAAFDGELKGEVIEVGRLIGAPKLRDPNPLARSDLRAAQVKIRLDAAANNIAKRFVHLQVNITIQLK